MELKLNQLKRRKEKFMLRARLIKPGNFKLEECPIPIVKKDEILIKVIFSGICGSDIHSFLGRNPFCTYPIVLGHEFVGRIVDTGHNVKKFYKDQIVTAEPCNPCGECVYCKRGDYHLCANPGPWNGSFSEYMIIKEYQAFLVPERINLKDAVLIEPLAFAFHSMKISKIQKNDKILVFGAGTIGQLIAKTARYYGARFIAVADLFKSKLALASKSGADMTIQITKDSNYEDIANIIMKNSIDIVFDCVCNEFSINSSIQIVKKRGRVVVIAVSQGLTPVDLGKIMINELIILGCLMYKNNFPESIEAISTNKVNVSDCISKKVFELKKINEAFKEIIENKKKYIKCLIKC